jgi:hypothetical protein
MTNEHRIAPPTELVQELWDKLRKAPDASVDEATAWTQAITQAVQWGADQQLNLDAEQIGKAYQAGADQELEACRQWLEINGAPYKFIDGLLAARRPKPPSLKEQALDALEEIDGYAIDQLRAYTIHDDLKAHADTIRRALELLPDDTTP